MTDQHDSFPILPSEATDSVDLHPIREVARLTGVNPITLRAWERRYGLLVPHRTASGHRLYSQSDIERVRAVTGWIERGVAVGKVAALLDRQPARAGEIAKQDVTVEQPLQKALQAWQPRVASALEQADVDLLDRLYGQLCAAFPLALIWSDVLLPVWRRLPAGSVHWALLDSFLRGRLFQRLAFRDGACPSVLLVALPGPQRELEGLVLAVCMADAAVNVSYLTSTTAEHAELTLLAQRGGYAALVLYAERTLDQVALGRQLPRLAQAIECPVAVIGSVCELQRSALEQAGLVCLGDADVSVAERLRALLAGRLDR